MTSIYDEQGKAMPVTVIEAGPCHVIQVKTRALDGYDAVQIGFGPKREKLANKPDNGRFKKAGIGALKYVRELRVKDPAPYKAGQKIEADIFAKGDYVDIEGISIGKGFQGGVKRWGWAGGDGGHGSMFHRAIGSIQSGARLNRVTKGHHMAGHMGTDRITVQNLEVIEVDKSANVIVVKGCIPGHKNSFVVVKEAVKRPKGFVKKKVVQQVSKKSAKAAAKAAVASAGRK